MEEDLKELIEDVLSKTELAGSIGYDWRYTGLSKQSDGYYSYTFLFENKGTMEHLFEKIYYTHYLTSNGGMDEITEEKIRLVSIYLFREFSKTILYALTEKGMKVSLTANFIFDHSSMTRIKHTEIFDTFNMSDYDETIHQIS